MIGAIATNRPWLSTSASIRTLSPGGGGLRARFQFGNPLQGPFSQSARFPCDVGLANALDVRHPTVNRGDQLVQMTELARAIRLRVSLVTGHDRLLPSIG